MYHRDRWEYKEKEDAETMARELRFRAPMQVRQIRCFRGFKGRFSGFPVCPQCGITMEREYQAYCDRCGQCLGWKHFKKATILFPAEYR